MRAQEEIVKLYRERIIEGKCLDLIPLGVQMLGRIVELRNQERSLYGFYQTSKLTLEDQTKWFSSYMERSDDLYWGIFSKSGEMVGATRLYEITEHTCDQGSFVLDENRGLEAPYALESMLLVLRFAFEKLCVEVVVNDDRAGNKMMNSITKRVGFALVKDIEIRGELFHHYELTKGNFREQMLETLLSRWMSR